MVASVASGMSIRDAFTAGATASRRRFTACRISHTRPDIACRSAAGREAQTEKDGHAGQRNGPGLLSSQTLLPKLVMCVNAMHGLRTPDNK